MNSGTLIKSMKRLIKASTRKIFLVIDNLKVRCSYIVRNWLEKHKEQISEKTLKASELSGEIF